MGKKVKRPAACTTVTRRPASSTKRPGTLSSATFLNSFPSTPSGVYVYPEKTCPVCAKALYMMKGDKEVFDGDFGVHRKLVDKVDGPRTVRVSGHPKKLREHERTASCARKDSLHYALPQRTAGWQFGLDPESRKKLGAKEHISNESHVDQAKLLKDVMTMSNVKLDVLIHDDMCHFEKFVKKRTPKDFMGIKYWLVDLFHCKNHLCNKKEWRPCEHNVANTSEPICRNPSMHGFVHSISF